MNWGKWIVLSFVLFAVFIGVLVTVCVQQDVNLVSRDYYQQELSYQGQIDRIQNANQLKEKPSIIVVGRTLDIKFSEFSSVENGTIDLFRPSDPKLDKRFSFQRWPDETQRFDITGLPEGMYHARMRWTMNGKEYYIEKTITI